MGSGGLILGSVASGLMQSSAAKSAASAQADAAEKAAQVQLEATEKTIAEQRRQYDLARSDLGPYRESGYNALAALNYELGLGPRPTLGQPLSFGGSAPGAAPGGSPAEIPEVVKNVEYPDRFQFLRRAMPDSLAERDLPHTTTFNVGDEPFDSEIEARAYRAGMRGAASGGAGGAAAPQNALSGFDYKGFQASPGYEFRRDEGMKGLERAASARGLRLSGGTLKDAMRFGQGLASEEYGNFYNRLASMAGIGQTAVNTGASLGAGKANAIGNALMTGAANRGSAYMAAGKAQAQGILGSANALSGTFNTLAQNWPFGSGTSAATAPSANGFWG